MKRFLGLVCCALAMACVGCKTVPDTVPVMTPVIPVAGERVIVDHITVLVDVTGSIGSSDMFDYQKALVQAFANAMPDGDYLAGMASFSGVSQSQWLWLPMTRFNRELMVEAANAIQPLGDTTPMDEAVRTLTPEFAGRSGRGALVVFSDGIVRFMHDPIRPCADMVGLHAGELCIYTVQVGDSVLGQDILRDMTLVGDCGRYYDGAFLKTAESMEEFVRDVFFGPGAATSGAAVREGWTPPVVHFAYDKSFILPEYQAVLDETAAVLKANPGMQVVLEGHTDAIASDAYNQRLSERRAAVVRAALVERGVEPARITTRAYGEERPAAPNTTPPNRSLNRRVELILID